VVSCSDAPAFIVFSRRLAAQDTIFLHSICVHMSCKCSLWSRANHRDQSGACDHISRWAIDGKRCRNAKSRTTHSNAQTTRPFPQPSNTNYFSAISLSHHILSSVTSPTEHLRHLDRANTKAWPMSQATTAKPSSETPLQTCCAAASAHQTPTT
jgi:hypothetical protein